MIGKRLAPDDHHAPHRIGHGDEEIGAPLDVELGPGAWDLYVCGVVWCMGLVYACACCWCGLCVCAYTGVGGWV
jgi:hypothetical protein